MQCDSAFPPACVIQCYCLSVSNYGRKPAGTEDPLKQSEESPEKSDQDSNCKWTTGSRRLGRRLQHIVPLDEGKLYIIMYLLVFE